MQELRLKGKQRLKANYCGIIPTKIRSFYNNCSPDKVVVTGMNAHVNWDADRPKLTEQPPEAQNDAQ